MGDHIEESALSLSEDLGNTRDRIREERPLPENCVLTVEPKIVLPGKGSVGIEDTLWVTADGPHPLTGAPEMVIL